MIVIFLFLGSVRKTLVIALSIPLSLLATFVMMGMGGLTLNIMSLGGLALGVGLLLDNAIVMLENVYRRRDELGDDAETAAHRGASEVTSAVVASTTTNLAAVVPFLLITGLTALIFKELILTISFAILASLPVALTLVPMLAHQLTRIGWSSRLGESRPLVAFDRGMERSAAATCARPRRPSAFAGSRWRRRAGPAGRHPPHEQPGQRVPAAGGRRQRERRREPAPRLVRRGDQPRDGGGGGDGQEDAARAQRLRDGGRLPVRRQHGGGGRPWVHDHHPGAARRARRLRRTRGCSRCRPRSTSAAFPARAWSCARPASAACGRTTRARTWPSPSPATTCRSCRRWARR